MRFLHNGPSIPEALLEDRDLGNVVFFCGAGVSQPLFPGFLQLANQVVERLGPLDDAPSRKLLAQANEDSEFALDRVFYALQGEFGAEIIDEEVSGLLRTPRHASAEQHKIVLRLSRSIEGRAQIVTTNFDLLFERAERSVPRHIAPALPDLANGQPLSGIVYLHGRRTDRRKPGQNRQGFVISSADFGRAYLAQGWATRFAKDLLQRYVIVLLGYSATDPPVRYLLEGLHSLQGDASSGSIYAFAPGSDADVSDAWRARGVRAIGYPPENPGHSGLWDSLKEWARRANDPEAWRKSVVDLARRGPRALKPHQRGQVVALVRSERGAKAFADEAPPRPAEWLCVFDRQIRLAEPERLSFKTDSRSDPLAWYRLDDDAPLGSNTGGDPGDVLTQNPFDANTTTRKALVGAAIFTEPLPSRLWHLSRWIGKVLAHPITAWWAAGYPALHPQLIDHIEWALDRSEQTLPRRARKIWRLLMEECHHSPNEDLHRDWYTFRNHLKKDGWSNLTLREFERVVQPYLRSTRPLLRRSAPPTGRRMHDIVEFEVKFPGEHGDKLTIPKALLVPTFRALSQGLRRGAQLLADIEKPFLGTVTFHPESKPGELLLGESDTYLRWAVELFDRLVAENREAARNEVRTWPAREEYFFDKLRLYAWGK